MMKTMTIGNWKRYTEKYSSYTKRALNEHLTNVRKMPYTVHRLTEWDLLWRTKKKEQSCSRGATTDLLPQDIIRHCHTQVLTDHFYHLYDTTMPLRSRTGSCTASGYDSNIHLRILVDASQCRQISIFWASSISFLYDPPNLLRRRLIHTRTRTYITTLLFLFTFSWILTSIHALQIYLLQPSSLIWHLKMRRSWDHWNSTCFSTWHHATSSLRTGIR